MPSYDIKISKRKEDIKRRPSIELCLSHQKPIFIISRNMNGPHILTLIEQLEKYKIPYQIQQQTQTLGFVLNQQFFLIVDNKYGEVMLGGDFSSKFMTIVGYPKLGRNTICKYLEKPNEVIDFYKDFKSKIKSKQSIFDMIGNDNIIVSQPQQDKVKNKIEIKSISKYNSPNGKQNANAIIQNQKQTSCLGKVQEKKVKAFILENKGDPQYQNVIQHICKQLQPQFYELVQSVIDIRKKTLFIKNQNKLIYICNKDGSDKLISNIFMGEVVIYYGKCQVSLQELVKQPKIYGIAVNETEILKMLKQLGLPLSNDPFKSNLKQRSLQRIQTSVLDGNKKRQSFLLSRNNFNQNSSPMENQKLQIRLIQNKDDKATIKKQESQISIFENLKKDGTGKGEQINNSKTKQVWNDKLDIKFLDIDHRSSLSKFYSKSSFNQSSTSNLSNRKKIKRLHKSKSKINTQESKDVKREGIKKQAELQIHKQESILKSKRSLKMIKQPSDGKEKKKNIHFDNAIQLQQKEQTYLQKYQPQQKETQTQKQQQRQLQKSETKQIRKIQTIINLQPQIYFNNQSQIQIDLSNDNQYYRQAKPQYDHSGSLMRNSSSFQTNRLINGIFYRQFVPKFENLINLIKLKPQLLNCNSKTMFNINSFVYISQYDRQVRRLKHKLRQGGMLYQEYNLMVLLEEEQYDKFYDYCVNKNNLYNEQGNQFMSTIQSQYKKLQNLSINNYTSKLNVYILMEEDQASFKQNKSNEKQIVQLQNIKIHIKYLPNYQKDTNLIKTVCFILEYVQSIGLKFVDQPYMHS